MYYAICICQVPILCCTVYFLFLSNHLPSDFQNDLYYDAKVGLSRQALAEIWKLLEGMDSCRMGDLDDALSQILVDLKAHELEASRWHSL